MPEAHDAYSWRGKAAIIRPGELGIADAVRARGDVTYRVLARDLRRWYVALEGTPLPTLSKAQAEGVCEVARWLDPHASPRGYVAEVGEILPGLSVIECLAVLDAVERAQRMWLMGAAETLEDALKAVGVLAP